MSNVPADMRAGAIYSTKGYGLLVVVDYLGAKHVIVRFRETGFQTVTRADHVRSGSVRDPLYPSVIGIGFVGVGKYTVRFKGKYTKAFQVWQGMIHRCYSEAQQKIQPTYKGCAVCHEWHNFQTFAKWYYENYPADGKSYQLDKDILVEGNKVYSPETCAFVSHAENSVKAHAKHYTFINPEGVEVEVYNLRQFCSSNDLHHGCMCQVYSGKLHQHKGWAAIVSEETSA